MNPSRRRGGLGLALALLLASPAGAETLADHILEEQLARAERLEALDEAAAAGPELAQLRAWIGEWQALLALGRRAEAHRTLQRLAAQERLIEALLACEAARRSVRGGAPEASR